MTTLVDYASVTSLPEVWELTADKFGEFVALHDPHAKPEIKLTYTQLFQQIQQFATGLQALGIQPDEKVSLFADNSPRWFIVDQGIIMAGAVNVVRSSQADRDELLYILKDSNSTKLVVENVKTLQKLRPYLDELLIELIILLSDEEPNPEDSIKTLNFQQLIALGKERPYEVVAQDRQTLATLVYTSGTTGKPKGVMLSHGNLLHQIVAIATVIRPEPGDRAVSILPSWHCYERAAEYFLLSQGCAQIYSNIRTFKADLKRFQPQVIAGVPRLWESIYEGVQKQFREQSATQQKLVSFFLDLSERYIIAKRIAEGLSLDRLHASASERAIAGLKATLLAPLHALGDRLVYQKSAKPRAATLGS